MYTVHQAKTNLSKLIRKAEKGERVIISRGDKPVVELVRILNKPKKRVPGRLKGQINIPASFFDPMTEEELSHWGIE